MIWRVHFEKVQTCLGTVINADINGLNLVHISGIWGSLHFTAAQSKHLGQVHIETQADARQGRAGQGEAARETLRDTV